MSAPLNHTMLAITFEDMPLGHESLKVPEHITVLPWFDISEERDAHLAALGDVISNTAPLRIAPGETTVFGAEGHEKKVTRVLAPGLKMLHKHLLQLLIDNEVGFSHPQWLGELYDPHYRSGYIAAVAPGEWTPVSDITVIDNFDHVKVVTNILRLGGYENAA